MRPRTKKGRQSNQRPQVGEETHPGRAAKLEANASPRSTSRNPRAEEFLEEACRVNQVMMQELLPGGLYEDFNDP
jgi:hypothetical protein